MKRRTGFAFDYSPEIAKGRIITLKEDKERRINVDNNITNDENKLIIGDNYNALKALLITHKNLINIIYIDPPYNTESAKNDGNNDSYKESTSSKFIYKDKFGRCGWLNMMKDRLTLAKDLLTDDGVIFVSIDDSEQAYLKVLMDDIFGENNFVSTICVELTKTQGMKVSSAKNGSIVKGYEFVLIYTFRQDKKIIENILYDDVDKRFDIHYNQWFEKNNEYLIPLMEYFKKNDFVLKTFNKYNFKINIKNISILMEIDKEFNKFILDNSHNIYHKRNIDSSEIQNLNIEKNKIINYKKYLLIKGNDDVVKQLQPMSMSIKQSNSFNGEVRRTAIRGNFWKGFDKDLANLDKEGFVSFKNGKKPLRLIKQLIKWVNNENDIIILDFFAGSGTTGQAVMDLNREDDGSRKFILCTNNENNIAHDVTYKRLHKVIKPEIKNQEKVFLDTDNKQSYENNKLRVIDIHDNQKISLDVDIEDKIFEDCKNGLKLLDGKYNRKELNLYYDLAALNPLKKDCE